MSTIKFEIEVEDKELWYINCISFADGGRKRDPLEVIDYKSTSYKKLTDRLKIFARGQKYIIEFTSKRSTK